MASGKACALSTVCCSISKRKGLDQVFKGLHLQLPEVLGGAHAAVHTEDTSSAKRELVAWPPATQSTGPRLTVTETSKGRVPGSASQLENLQDAALAPQRSLQEGLMTPWVFTVVAGKGSEHLL